MANRDLIAEAGADSSGVDASATSLSEPGPAEAGQEALAAREPTRRLPQRPTVESSRSLPIAVADREAAAVNETPAASRRQGPCWVALHFPALPLMVGDFPEGLPGVVIHETGGRQLIHAACPLAADLGVSPGMPLNAAHVLGRNLVVRLRDPLAEYRWLKRQSELLQRFTPMVSLGLWETAAKTVAGAARGAASYSEGSDRS